MNYKIASLKKLQQEGNNIERLPFSIRILLENVLRNHDAFAITDEHLETLIHWIPSGTDKDIPFKPARVLMQDFTGVPAVVDITSIRDEFVRKGGDGSKINPAIPVDLVIDHSVQVDYFGADSAYKKNVDLEYERNAERYKLLKWAQKGLDNFTVVLPEWVYATRSILNTWPKALSNAKAGPSPTRLSEPTLTPLWSTELVCWPGE